MTTVFVEPTASECPACGARMSRLATLKGLVAGCLCCGGIWVDHHFGKRVVEASVSEPTKAFFRHVAESAGGPRPADYRTAARRDERTCPMCRGELVAQPFGPRRIVLDLCHEHGTFFDLREIDAVVRDAEMTRAVADVDAERRAAVRDGAIFEMFDTTNDRW